ncbi:MAG: 50S ribosomal protein L9 [Halobacteriovoraceae bacterium]|nr:50S ribosomal protein L9 [Halobacteriovoraceae bacterium]|tara:strand:+ start:36895 stop:37473 length:579 start_codon:yes stop_codon:yes gene_type:complete
MKVILTDRVKTLGNVGEIVNVSQGYARNYLIPNKLALLADEGNTKQMEDYQKMLSKKVEEEKKAAQDLAKQLEGKTITVTKKVGGNGRLFGTVTSSELSKELEKQGVVVEKRLINVDDPIKTLGDFEVKAQLFQGVEATFKVKVEMDPKQVEEEKKKQEAAAKKAGRKGAKEGEEAKADDAEAQENAEETQA